MKREKFKIEVTVEIHDDEMSHYDVADEICILLGDHAHSIWATEIIDAVLVSSTP
jgi:hypothetical protein